MKNIAPNLYEVEDEPGDATHYSVFVYVASAEHIRFMPKNNTFKYPPEIDYWDVKDLLDKFDKDITYRDFNDETAQAVREMANDFNVNLYTLIECFRIIKRIIQW